MHPKTFPPPLQRLAMLLSKAIAVPIRPNSRYRNYALEQESFKQNASTLLGYKNK
jgi:hypothetical protein